MQELPLQMWAVLAAGLARFFFGWLWFSPGLFMKPWIQSAGINEKRLKQGVVFGMSVALAGSLLMAFVLAHAIKYAQMAHGLPEGLAGGLAGGFINWLGLVAVSQLDGVTAEKKPFKWFAITSGYQLVGMLIMGAILSLWA
jgi:hypothetical protein